MIDHGAGKLYSYTLFGPKRSVEREHRIAALARDILTRHDGTSVEESWRCAEAFVVEAERRMALAEAT